MNDHFPALQYLESRAICFLKIDSLALLITVCVAPLVSQLIINFFR